ncbi:hypothetical protein WA026_010583 [Henosepilachna vigintioctopunctata]|uniref:Uncharacterized protein n=1 Tax=Henosepilachna vigintioctopunctata TaxID=420089 RepID=A0AAW1VAN3_9CUCU
MIGYVMTDQNSTSYTMTSKVSSKASVGLLRKFWHEKPEILGSSVMGLIGLILSATAVKRYYARDLDNRRYREEYTVIRHDDPKAATLRKDYLAN